MQVHGLYVLPRSWEQWAVPGDSTYCWALGSDCNLWGGRDIGLRLVAGHSVVTETPRELEMAPSHGALSSGNGEAYVFPGK